MFSTLTILSLFAEIFTAGILLTGGHVFFKAFLQKRKPVPFLLALIFTSFSLCVVGTVCSQLMTNIGASVSSRMFFQRIINSMLAFCSVTTILFAIEKLGIRLRWLWAPFILAGLALCYLCFASQINLVYRFDVVEPTVDFTGITIIRYLWFFSWVMLGVVSLIKAVGAKERKEINIYILSGLSSLLVASGFVGYLLYINLGDGIYLLLSWTLTFFAFSGFLLANVISPKDNIALAPLNFLRSRILFKLVILFVLMIVLIVEATTLATIAISRASLLNAVIETDRQIAVSVADKALYISRQKIGKKEFIDKLQETVGNISLAQKQTAYIVDIKGRLIAHPDEKRALAGESMMGVYAVKEISEGRSGGGEFVDKSGDLLVGAYVFVPELGIGVIAYEPIRQAYSEIRKVETNSLIFVIVGIIITVVVGLYFARNIEKQINALIVGTEAIRKGNLNYRIQSDSMDEIGHLAAEFNKMTVELKESQDHLVASEKLAALGTMAAGMAHEIKNPLVALRTFTQLLPLKWEDRQFREKFGSIVPPEIDKINRISENLLKFGKPSKPEFKLTNINAVLEEVLELMENQFKRSNIRVATKFAHVPEINGDSSQLPQAFLNIILNAIQAMPQGGELVIKSDVGQVIQFEQSARGERRTRQEQKGPAERRTPTVFVEITDSGQGIPEDKMKNLFDPFFTTKESGTGMGLPITLRIIEDHKGSIKVRSQVNKGTSFIIMLPVGKKG